MTISPGGRPADASPIGTPGGRQNWVDKTGGLPRYMRMIAHALMRKGMTESHAIAAAHETLVKLAATSTNPHVKAAAAAAIAEFNAKRASARMDLSGPTDGYLDVNNLVDLSALPVEDDTIDLAPGDYHPPYDWKHGFIPLTPAAALSKAKKGPNAGKGRAKAPKGAAPRALKNRSVAGKGRRDVSPEAAARLAKAKDDAARGRATPGELQAAQNAVNASGPKKTPGPSNAEKIRNAETMHGTGSKQHLEAQRRFGGDSKPTVASLAAKRAEKAAAGPVKTEAERRAQLASLPWSRSSARGGEVGVSFSPTRQAELRDLEQRGYIKMDRRGNSMNADDQYVLTPEGKRLTAGMDLHGNTQQRARAELERRAQESAADKPRVSTPGGGSYPTKADGSPDYGAMSAEQAATVRAKQRGIGVGAKVDTDRGPGTVKSVSTRGTTVELDDPNAGAVHIPAGTPGHARITPQARRGADKPGDLGTTGMSGKSRPRNTPTDAERTAAQEKADAATAKTLEGKTTDQLKRASAQHRAAGRTQTADLIDREVQRRRDAGQVPGNRNTDRRPTDPLGRVDSPLPNRSDETATDNRAQARAIERKDYANADGPALANAAADRGLIGRERAMQKSDAELRTMLRNDDAAKASRASAEAVRAKHDPATAVDRFAPQRQAMLDRKAQADAPSSNTTSTNPGAPIRVEHTPDGTLVHGTSREDAPDLKAAGFKWSRNLDAWYLPRSWGESTREQRVRQLEAKLGDKVGVDRTTGPRMSAAERDAETRARAAARADRMDARSAKNAAEAESRRKASDAITQHIPMGQPILVGHHSEGKHRRDIARSHSHMEKSWQADAQAKADAEAADRARRTAAGAESPVTTRQRIARKEAELRSVQKKLDDEAAMQGIENKLGADHPAMKKVAHTRLSPAYKQQLENAKATLEDEIAHNKSKLEASGAKTYGKDTVAPGDFVQVHGRWYPVTKANAKTVGIPSVVGGSWDDKAPWDKVTGHRKAADMTPEQLDKLAAAEKHPKAKAAIEKAAADRRTAAGASVSEARARGVSAGAAAPAAPAATTGGITPETARRMSDAQLEQAFTRLFEAGGTDTAAIHAIEKELDRRDAARRAEGNGRRR